MFSYSLYYPALICLRRDRLPDCRLLHSQRMSWSRISGVPGCATDTLLGPDPPSALLIIMDGPFAHQMKVVLTDDVLVVGYIVLFVLMYLVWSRVLRRNRPGRRAPEAAEFRAPPAASDNNVALVFDFCLIPPKPAVVMLTNDCSHSTTAKSSPTPNKPSEG